MISKTFRAALIGLTSLGLAACSGEEETETTETTETETTEPATEAPEEAMADVDAVAEIYMAAIANPARPESDSERDEGRKPAEALAFYGIEPGMTIVDPAIYSSNGFELAGEGDALRNPDDDHSLNVFHPDIRGRTDRFLLVFRKPA